MSLAAAAEKSCKPLLFQGYSRKFDFDVCWPLELSRKLLLGRSCEGAEELPGAFSAKLSGFDGEFVRLRMSLFQGAASLFFF